MFLRRKSVILSFLVILFIGYSSFMYINLPKTDKHAAEADNGKMVWQKYNCGACHQVFGLGGFLGPDLTNVTSKRDSNFIAAIIKHGTGVMPSLGVNDAEINNLIEYLEVLNRSGSADPRTFKIELNGNIQQEIN